MTRLALLLMLTACLTAAASAQAKVRGLTPVSGPTYVEGEIIVKYRPDHSHQSHLRSIARHHGRFLKDLGEATTLHARLAPGRTVADSLDEYNLDAEVEYAQPNFYYHGLNLPNTSDYSQLWGFKNTGQHVNPSVGSLRQPQDGIDTIDNPPAAASSYYDTNVEPAWNVTTDCSNIVVAVIDSGINAGHNDLVGNMWNGASAAACPGGATPTFGCDFLLNTATPYDQFGHGTHVAGTIGAKGSTTVSHGHTGVCWTAQLMALRVLDDVNGLSTTTTLTSAINYAVANGAKVLNMSLGGPGYDPTVEAAIANARASNVVAVVAAGNNSSNNDITPFYPCNDSASNLVCVAAVDQASALASFSNYGASSVMIGAPGTNIESTWAGQNVLVPGPSGDPLTGSGWNLSTYGAGSGFGFTNVTVFQHGLGVLFGALTDPNNFNYTTEYTALAEDLAYRSYAGTLNTGANIATTLNITAWWNLSVSTSDTVYLYRATDGTNPFLGSGTQVTSLTGSSNNYYYQLGAGYYPADGIDATAWVQGGANDVTVGALLIGQVPNNGVAFDEFYFNQLSYRVNNQYSLIEGTSMATPHVAGLAAMLLSYNHSIAAYSYTDAINAIRAGGVPLTSLTGKTQTGRAINIYNSMTYVAPPSGLTATVAP